MDFDNAAVAANLNEAARRLTKAAEAIQNGGNGIDEAEVAQVAGLPAKLQLKAQVPAIPGADAVVIVAVSGGVDRAALVRRLSRAEVGGNLAFYSAGSGRRLDAGRGR